MREAANAEDLKDGQERLILSIALPGGPYHGQHFLLPKLTPYGKAHIFDPYNFLSEDPKLLVHILTVG